MDDRPEPQRIEIELTPHDPSGQESGRARRPVEAAWPATIESGDVEPLAGVLATERGRLIAVGVFAATIALLLGVLVGRLGSGGVETTDGALPSTSSTSSEPATTMAGGSDANTLPPAPAIVPVPPTTRRPASTSIAAGGDADDPERLVTGRIEVDPGVPRDPIEVVALTGRGEVVRIDVASGTTVSTRVEGGQLGFGAIHAGTDWILVPSFDERRASTVIHDDGSRSTLDAGVVWPLMANGATGTFWSPGVGTDSGAPEQLVEIEVDGSPTGDVIELAGFYPQTVDPRGGVVVQAPGGYFVVSSASTSLITTGRLLGIGLDRAVVQECSDSLDCGYFVVDRSSGERSRLDLAPELADTSTSIEPAGWWMNFEPMSPTGDALLVFVWMPGDGGRQSLGVLDLTSGEFEQIGSAVNFVDPPSLAWAPDGGAVYWIDGGRVQVFDRSTGASTPFADDLVTVTAIALRSAAPTTESPASVPSEDG